MIVLKKYHFHAAHRNVELKDKCTNIHGHTYHLEVHLAFSSNHSVTMPFSEIDAKIEPLLKTYDHAFIIDRNDPLYRHLLQFDPELKMKVLDVSSTAENVSRVLFDEIKGADLPIVKIVLQETTTSAVVYEGI